MRQNVIGGGYWLFGPTQTPTHTNCLCRLSLRTKSITHTKRFCSFKSEKRRSRLSHPIVFIFTILMVIITHNGLSLRWDESGSDENLAFHVYSKTILGDVQMGAKGKCFNGGCNDDRPLPCSLSQSKVTWLVENEPLEETYKNGTRSYEYSL